MTVINYHKIRTTFVKMHDIDVNSVEFLKIVGSESTKAWTILSNTTFPIYSMEHWNSGKSIKNEISCDDPAYVASMKKINE